MKQEFNPTIPHYELGLVILYSLFIKQIKQIMYLSSSFHLSFCLFLYLSGCCNSVRAIVLFSVTARVAYNTWRQIFFCLSRTMKPDITFPLYHFSISQFGWTICHKRMHRWAKSKSCIILS